jgi:hypothetical protein
MSKTEVIILAGNSSWLGTLKNFPSLKGSVCTGIFNQYKKVTILFKCLFPLTDYSSKNIYSNINST